jgi:hypothetical protein
MQLAISYGDSLGVSAAPGQRTFAPRMALEKIVLDGRCQSNTVQGG